MNRRTFLALLSALLPLKCLARWRKPEQQRMAATALVNQWALEEEAILARSRGRAYGRGIYAMYEEIEQSLAEMGWVQCGPLPRGWKRDGDPFDSGQPTLPFSV